MDIDKARKTLAFLKKRKMGVGDDLSVFVKGSDVIQNQILMLVVWWVYGMASTLRHVEAGKLRFTLIGLSFLLVAFWFAKRYQKKIAKIRDYMLDHKAFYLTELEQKGDESSSPESSVASK